MARAIAPDWTAGTNGPQGPRGLPWVGSALSYHRDPKRFLESCLDRFGPVARFGLWGMTVYAVAEPNVIDGVLRGRPECFDKGWREPQPRGNRRPYRAVVQPAFHAERMAGYAPRAEAAALAAVNRWTPGAPLDVLSEMTALGLEIFAESLFDAKLPVDAMALARAVAAINRYLADPFSLTPWGRKLPLPSRRAYLQAIQVMDQALYPLIAARRREGAAGSDALSALLNARDGDGTPRTDQQIRAQLIKPLIAGPDTTALLLTYALHLIATHPAVEAKLCDELDGSAREDSQPPGQLPRLPYLGCILREVMRLYPSLWAIGRGALEDCTIGGLQLKKGDQLLLCLSHIQRDTRWFTDPDRFIPERWSDGLASRLPRGVYLPLGDGPHICLGNHFAVMQATVVLATLFRQCRFRPVDDRPLTVSGSMTLRPARPVAMEVERRRT